MDAPIRLLLVEDNEVFRDSLEFLLGRRDDITVVGAIPDGSSAAASYERLGADVAVIDFRLPDIDGAAAAAEVRERSPGAGVVFLSASAGDEERNTARLSGIALIRKDEGVDALVGAVRAAAGREDG
jgi:DNA-binding NarL/FixJ family response regulator